MILSQIFVHPIKSCRAISVANADAQARGLAHDRRMMIVRSDGEFITQRSHPRMAQIKTLVKANNVGFLLEDKLWFPEFGEDRTRVSVWRDSVMARLADEHVQSALSEFLGEPVKLVMMDKDSQRMSNEKYADSEVSFADGYPILITNSASLKALSETAGFPLQIEQFRPNLVINTDKAWAEDGWKYLAIGDVELELVKPCTRCVMTTLDPITGKPAYPETMQALIKTRKSNFTDIPGVLFGWNAVVKTPGILSVGSTVRVSEERS